MLSVKTCGSIPRTAKQNKIITTKQHNHSNKSKTKYYTFQEYRNHPIYLSSINHLSSVSLPTHSSIIYCPLSVVCLSVYLPFIHPPTRPSSVYTTSPCCWHSQGRCAWGRDCLLQGQSDGWQGLDVPASSVFTRWARKS